MPISIYNFTTSPYITGEINLGSFVPDNEAPNQDAIGSPALVVGIDYSKKPDRILQDASYHGSSISIGFILSWFFHGSIDRTFDSSSRIVSDDGYMYQLLEPRALFRQMLKERDVQEWLNDQYDAGEPSFFITGYRTLVDTALLEKSDHEFDGSVEGSAPVASGMQLGVRAKAMLKHGYTAARELPGERIFAIQFKKVKLKTITGKDKPRLDSGAWKYYNKYLGEADVQDEVEWMEAELSDEDEVFGEEGIGFMKVNVED